MLSYIHIFIIYTTGKTFLTSKYMNGIFLKIKVSLPNKPRLPRVKLVSPCKCILHTNQYSLQDTYVICIYACLRRIHSYDRFSFSDPFLLDLTSFTPRAIEQKMFTVIINKKYLA